MTYTDRHIVDSYSSLFEGLSDHNKIELITRLAQSLKTEKATKDAVFFATFGAWDTEQTAESIIADIKDSRKFRKKNIEF